MSEGETLRIGVTGADGMIGWHMRAFLRNRPGVETIPASRAAFESVEKLQNFASGCDAIVHLAGMNRGEDEQVERVNVELAEKLIGAVEKTGRKPHIIFSSSTHIYRGTAYGRSKKKCAELFSEWAEKAGAVFTNLILPHVFGEFGKPFYNSVVHTFCHQLANDERPKIIKDGELELLSAQQVAEEIFRVITEKEGGELSPKGAPMLTSELLAKLEGFKDLYGRRVFPSFENETDLLLFNAYRSYLYPAHYPVPLELHSDERGALFEAVKTLNGGQCFISTTKPGITRGEHYHRKKVERFLVIRGEAVIRLRKIFTNEVLEFKVSGERPQYVDMPTFHTHNITNMGSGELMTLFWAHELYDPENPDTIYEPV